MVVKPVQPDVGEEGDPYIDSGSGTTTTSWFARLITSANRLDAQDNAGKTTLLYRLKVGETLST